ncbi:MAG: CHAD domain-containing protein [Halopseudomonas sp.]
MDGNLRDYLQSSLVCQYRALDQHLVHLADPAAPEALHQTRIALRSLRSLLRPWRDQGEWLGSVDCIAAELGRSTSPLRDRQVLIQELEERGLHYQAVSRAESVATACRLLGSDHRYHLLLLAIISLEERLAAGGADYQLNPATLADYTDNLVRKLLKILRHPHQDLHNVRIEIKKLRYLYQAYYEHLGPSPELTRALKRAQAELGDWHDNLQWLLIAENESDLHCCRDYWQTQIDVKAQRAQKRLKKLRKLLQLSL